MQKVFDDKVSHFDEHRLKFRSEQLINIRHSGKYHIPAYRDLRRIRMLMYAGR